jgi:hypothetical protein
MTFEDELRRSLRRVDPPPGFATRVAAQAARQAIAPTRQPAPLQTVARLRARWLAAGLAASLVVAVGAAVAVLERQRDAEAKRARDLALQALRLTSAELSAIQERVAARAGQDRSQAP